MPVLSNPRHERFAQELAKGRTQAQAYAEAGYKPSIQHASRLATNGNIQARITELHERAAIRSEVTIASLTAELEEVRDLAIRDGQYAPAVAAIKEKAVLAGVRVEKSERKNVNAARELSDEELEAAIAGAAAREEAAKVRTPQLN